MKSKKPDLQPEKLPADSFKQVVVGGFRGPLAADAKPTTDPMQVYESYWPFKSKAERDAWETLQGDRD